MLKTFLAITLTLSLGLAPASAQAIADKIASPPPFAPKVLTPLPFKPGEQLRYEVNFSKFIFGGKIGELKMQVEKGERMPRGETLHFKAEAVSKGFFPSLFGVNVKDRFSAIVYADDFGLHSAKKELKEGKTHREQIAVIDRETGRVTYTERDLKNRKAEPKVKENASPAWIQDILSAIYYVRAYPMKEGDIIPVPISDGAETYNIEVHVKGREEVKTDAGKFNALLLDAKIFDGKFVRRSGEMQVWMSDDARRLPVKARVKTSGVTVTIELQK